MDSGPFRRLSSMETIQVIIAEISQLTRLGIIGLMKHMGYPVAIREVIHTGKLAGAIHKDHINLIIISSSFINSCSPDVVRTVLLKSRYTSRILIRDEEIRNKPLHGFDETIEKEDNERTIFRKLEKQVLTLSKSDSGLNQAGEISDREKEVLRLVALGMTNKEIAEKLYISSHTVITHRKNITSKLGIKTIAGLTVYAVIHKLIAPENIR
jgi:DNA-binding CsgD family transcriptional regulator